jgi:hypothetical protein
MSLFTQKFLLICVISLLSACDVFGEHTNSFWPNKDAFWPAKVTVNITNSLSENLDLTIHCKSKDDDLGSHLLHHGDSFSWRFGRKFFGGTLFYCSFQWNNELHWFDTYNQDETDCNLHCNWYIHQSGPCLLFDSKEVEDCNYSWNK